MCRVHDTSAGMLMCARNARYAPVLQGGRAVAGWAPLNAAPLTADIKEVPRASIALFLRTLANDYQDLLREDCLAAAGRRGYEVTVFSADNDSDRQSRQIRECLAEKGSRRPTVVFVSPV